MLGLVVFERGFEVGLRDVAAPRADLRQAVPRPAWPRGAEALARSCAGAGRASRGPSGQSRARHLGLPAGFTCDDGNGAGAFATRCVPNSGRGHRDVPTKVQAVRMRLNIGGTTREAASTSSYSFRLRQVNFSYAVVAVDADGISVPASAIVGASNWVTRNNRATNPASLTESALNGLPSPSRWSGSPMPPGCRRPASRW